MNSTRRIVLAARPHGAPLPSDFRLEQRPLPEMTAGQVRVRTAYLSLDPYMRGRMSDAPSYAPPVAIGETMVGGAVSRVDASAHPGFAIGDWVLGATGWQSHAVVDGAELRNLGPQLDHPSQWLGVLGMPGFTAYMGLLDIGQPQAGETVVVAAASGAVGSMVGQIAKIKGCRVVGIAGGSDKCAYLMNTLGFDAAIDHRDPEFAARLAVACPRGIDVYFENVGGAVFDAVMPLLNARARIPLCGLIAHYNATELPAGPDRMPQLQSLLLKKRIRMQGFIIFDDYGHRFGEFQQAMTAWLAEGRIVHREDVAQGLENAPAAFIGMLQGNNFGKLVVRVGDD